MTDTEIGLFSLLNSEKLYIFDRFRKTVMLSEKEILYFEGQNTVKFKCHEHRYCLNRSVKDSIMICYLNLACNRITNFTNIILVIYIGRITTSI